MNNKPPKITLREAAEMAVNVLEGLGYDPVDLQNALSEPIKQEPIGYVVEDDSGYTGSMVYANKSGDEFLPVYLAPVDAKAIRAEALEEAAKVCDDESRYSNDAECCAAAIRGLK